MKRLLKVAMLLGVVSLVLCGWSLRAAAASRTVATNGQIAQRHADLRTDVGRPANLRGIGSFTAVAALSAKDMWAVGSGLATLTEHWNGTQWSLVNSPSPGSEYNYLNGVAAIAANDIWAVGSYSNNPKMPATNTLIEHWNGIKWSVVSSPSPGALSNSLAAIAAISSNDVWAVGSSYSNGSLTLVEHWNGIQWSVVSSPSPNGGAFLNGVAAVSASNVWAVGYTIGGSARSGFSGGGAQQALIEQWNGSSWSVIASPSPSSSGNSLSGVTAVSASDVWAVGFRQASGSSPRTLIEHWNGTRWSAVTSPNGGAGNDQLYGVAALSSSRVWTVGFSIQQNGPPQTLTERWDGVQWSVVSSPNRIGGASLSSVAAISPTDIWAVGTDVSGALTEHWDGTQWSFVTNPNQGTVHFLSGVAALSTSDVWAVGQYLTVSGTLDTLTERWNGATWSIIPSPNATSQGNDLLGVAVVAAKDVWAVGNQIDSNGIQQVLIEHWDGAKWSIVPSPSPGVNGNSLNGVVAVSATDAWAVGYQTNGSGIQQALIEQWNGRQWNVVSSPSPGPTMNDLSGITALSATDVWAVGYHDGNNIVQTLIEHWNGTQWSAVTSPNTASGSFLNAVSAASANNAWAVGTSGTLFGVYDTLIEHWDGHAWSIVTSPSPGSAGSLLNGVVDLSGNAAWAVGSYSNNHFSSQTLTEYWDRSAWSAVKSPNVVTPPPAS